MNEPATIDPTDCSAALAALAAGATLVTVNNRLARSLLLADSETHRARGEQAWPAPDILPWGRWLQRQYEALVDEGHCHLQLLEPAQERLLWEDIIRDWPGADDLLRAGATARTAQQARQRQLGWRLEDARVQSLAGPDHLAFLQWHRRYRQLCEQRGWLDGAALPDLLCEQAAQLRLPTRIILAGFDQFSPQQLALFAALETAGCEPLILNEPTREADARCLALADQEGEIRAASAWALTRRRQHPQASIAILAPQLEQARAPLQRRLAELLQPQACLPGGLAEHPAWNVSLGESLARFPLVQDALLALRFTRQALPINEIGALLRSPFIGAESEFPARAALDALLRRQRRIQLGLPGLLSQLQHCDEAGPCHCPQLAAALAKTLQLLDGTPAQATPRQWADRFAALLEAFGWPGSRPLNSPEHQQAQRLRELLLDFGRLGQVRQRMSRNEALQRLQTLAGDTLFQPEGSPQALQIMGLLEAAGQRFDHLWVLGMDDEHWPPAPSPNPLLPVRLQRELDMPQCSAEHERAFAELLTRRLLAGAGELVFSHARRDGDRELRPSPLLNHIPFAEADELHIPPVPDLWAAGAPVSLQSSLDAQLPPLPSGSAVRGGSGVLTDQSACPFRAAANHRLGAETLEEPEPGLDNRERGTLVHAVLEQLWRDLQDQQSLQQMPPETLAERVADAVENQLRGLARHRPEGLGPRLHGLEKDRLCALMLGWLEREKARPAPFRVLRQEEAEPIELGGLQFNIRADRIDELADGGQIIIDYKTGKASASPWLEERLGEPQLPLYSVQCEPPPVAVTLARVRADRDGGFAGLAREENILPGIKAFAGQETAADWPALMERWRQSLTALADEFREGVARVDPQWPPYTCQYCGLDNLCRVHLQQEGEDD